MSTTPDERPAPPRTIAEYKAQMVYIPGGEDIKLGSDEPAHWNPVRTVNLQPYLCGRTTVTVGMWKEYAAKTGVPMPTEPEFNKGWKDDLQPIVNITWIDAKKYADWAGLFLISEDEWEFAARGREGRLYPWGDEWDPTKCVNAFNSPTGPGAVGSFPEGDTPEGVADMAGQVWEWTRTPFASTREP